MNKDAAHLDLVSIIRNLAIGSGDVVYVAVDMANVPLPKMAFEISRAGVMEIRDRYCAYVLDSLLDVIEDSGTLLVPTFCMSYASYGEPYHHEKTPSEVGPFTEYFRKREGVIRSLHPMLSIAGIGVNAAAILENIGKSGYGVCSPFMRFNDYRVKFLFLGLPLAKGLTYLHHLEHLYGVNHMYHKSYDFPVFKDNVLQPGPWLCFRRYLGIGIEAKLSNFEDVLRENGKLLEIRNSPYIMQSTTVEDVDRIAIEMLKVDPCAFLEKPISVHIDAPGTALPDTMADSILYRSSE